MISLPLPRAVREFWKGVCAIPELVDTSRVPWNPGDPISTITRLVCARDSAQEEQWNAVCESRKVIAELEAERAAHLATSEQCHLLANENHSLSLRLSAETAARKEAERKLRDEEERHAALQSRCYEGFPSVSDGIFDALREAERKLDALTRWRPQGSDYLHASVRALCATRNGDEYRHTPESLDAMEKAKSDGK
jgi:hypothetical protein